MVRICLKLFPRPVQGLFVFGLALTLAEPDVVRIPAKQPTA